MENSEKENEKKKGSNSNKIKSTESDIVLDIPEFEYDKVNINAGNLDAHVSVDASLGNMVTVFVGAEAQMDNVDIKIKNVEAEAHLIISLKRIKQILYMAGYAADKYLETIKPLLTPISNATGKSIEDLNKELLEIFADIDSTSKKDLDKSIIRNVSRTVRKKEEVKNKK